MFHLPAMTLAVTLVGKRATHLSGRTLPGHASIGSHVVDDEWQSGQWIALPEAQFGDSDALS
jgi:hypothetical protein